MSKISKERRRTIRQLVNNDPAFDGGDLSGETLSALLDMADERDRYRALLVDIYHGKWTDPDLMERIERALGTEHPRHDAALNGE